MKYLPFVIIALLACVSCTAIEHRDRQTIVHPFAIKNYDKAGNAIPRLKYEIDLNNDGQKDLILSCPITCAGTGGLNYSIYLGTDTKQYKLIDEVLDNGFALEKHGESKILWGYSHCSSQSGHIWYSRFDSKGNYEKSPALLIRAGDGGTEVSNSVYKAIFTSKAILKFEEVR